jgi:regulator of CtrA degradation
MSDVLSFEDSPELLTPVVLDGLYAEAMALAEEARAYFDQIGAFDRQQMDAASRVFFSCESLKVTTRLMHVIAWLLVRRAVETGEMDEAAAARPERRLGRASATDLETESRLAKLPKQAVSLIQRSQALYERVARIEAGFVGAEPIDASPVQRMMSRLEGSF